MAVPSDTPKVQIGITADATDAITNIEKVGKAAESLKDKTQAAGEAAAKPFERIAEKATEADVATNKATQTIVNSIRRAQAAESAGGRDQPDYYLNLAKQRGANLETVQREVDKLKELRTANAALNTVLGQTTQRYNEYGLTAKQTAAALRQVPAQLTDIVVSLQGGQAPLTVLLQQGGQLRDIFGGFVPAFKALGVALIGLVNPFTLVAAAAGVLAYAYNAGSSEAQAFNKTLILTGNAAGITSGELQRMAGAIDAASGAITQGRAAEFLNQLAGIGSIGAANFEKFTKAALEFEAAGGDAADKTLEKFTELGKAPTEASRKLNEATRYLTFELFKQIQALEEQGRTTEAATLAQNAYADAIQSRTPQLVQNLGYIERAWKAIKEAGKGALDEILNVGRATPLEQDLADLERLLANPKAGVRPERRKQLEEERDRLRQVVESNRLLVEQQSDQNKAEAARIALAERASGLDSELIRKRKEVATLTAQFSAATKGLAVNSAEYAEQQRNYLNSIKSVLGEAKDLPKQRESDAERYLDQLRRQLDSAEKISEVEKLTREIQRGNIKEITASQKEELYLVARLVDEKKAQIEAEKELEKIRKQAIADAIVRMNYEREFAQQQERYARELAGFGQGNRARSLEAGISQINDRYAAQRYDALTTFLRAAPEQRAEAERIYQEQLAIIEEYNNKATESYRQHFSDVLDAQKNWVNGANEAIKNYQENADNVAKATEEVFTRAIGGMEDALVQFVSTGKLSFTDLANSIVADITRIIIREQLSKSLGSFLPALGSSFFGETAANLFPGNSLDNFFSLNNNFAGRASGGPVGAGGLYRVNEQGPELLTVGANQYLMMGSQSGQVTPNNALGGTVINVSVPMPQGGSRATALQFGRDVASQLQLATMRNG